MKLNEALKDVRLKKGLSVKKVKEDTGIKWLYNYEATTVPPASSLILLADYYGVTLDELVGRKETEKREDVHKISAYHNMVEMTFGDKLENIMPKLPSDFYATMNYVMAVYLSDRQQDIIKKRFFDGMTLKEVGEIYKISHERVRQIETKALYTLKCELENLDFSIKKNLK